MEYRIIEVVGYDREKCCDVLRTVSWRMPGKAAATARLAEISAKRPGRVFYIEPLRSRALSAWPVIGAKIEQPSNTVAGIEAEWRRKAREAAEAVRASVLRMHASGARADAIAAELGLTVRQVYGHVARADKPVRGLGRVAAAIDLVDTRGMSLPDAAKLAGASVAAVSNALMRRMAVHAQH